MKKSLMIIAFLIICYSARSQILISLLFGDALNSERVEFGLDGGVNYSNINNLDPGKIIPLLNLGFYFDFKFSQHILLHTGVLVKSNQGADELSPYTLSDPGLDSIFATGYVTRKINNFSVPILMKYRFATYFHVEAGPMLALRTKGYDIFKNTINDKEDLSFKLDIGDQYKRIDAGIMVGAGFKISKVPKSTQVGVRYYYGLVDPLKDNTGGTQNFSSLYIYVSIPIGVGSAATEDK